MAEIFEYIAATENEQKTAKRRAVVASTHRITDKLGAFLGNAQNDEEKRARLELVKDEMRSIVVAACNDFGCDDAVSVGNAIAKHFYPEANFREASTKESVRRPRLCPYHKQVVDISLAQGEPKAGYEAMSQHSWSKQHCESDEYQGDSCKFRPEMTTKSYWDDRSQRNKEKREERDRVQQEQEQVHEETPNVTDEEPTNVTDSETPEVTDSGGLDHDLQSAPSAVGGPEHEARVAQGYPNTNMMQPLQAPQQPISPEVGQGIGGAAGQVAPVPGQAPVGPPPPQQPTPLQQAQQMIQNNQNFIPGVGQTSQVPGQQPYPQQQFSSIHTAGYTVEQLTDGSGRWKVIGPGGTSVGVYDTQQEAQTEANQLNRGVSNQNQAELAPTQSSTKVADSGNDNLGGPSPKMDKRKWTPQNLEQRVQTEGPDSPHPTKTIDPQTPISSDKADDFLDGTRAQTETQSVEKTWNNSGSGPTKTFDGKGQATPVTSSVHEALSKKDFELIAERIKNAPIESGHTELANHFADRLEDTNERFDRDRFVNAATPDSTKESSSNPLKKFLNSDFISESVLSKALSEYKES